MISLIQEPGPINLLCDEIKLGFVADGRLQTPGAKAGVSVYASPVNMPANTYLEFVWDGITERITFVANPDTSGNQCKLLTTGNFSTWDSVYLAEALRANYNIANAFAISNNPGAHTVTLTAITAGAKGLVVTKTSGTTGLTLSAVTAGTDPVYRENYGIVVQTFAAGYNNVWRKVSEDRLTPNSAGSAEADFGELLRKETSPAFAWPAGQAVTPRVGMTTKFYFKYGEIWDNDPQQLYKTTEYKGIWGGLPRAAHAKLDNIMADWWMSFKASKKFLTNMPAYVPTTISSPQRLYWLCMDAGLTAVFIKVKSWNVGGIDDVTMATISSPVQYQVYEIDASYQRMIYNSQASVNDYKYEVRVEKTDGTLLAGPQGYVINRKPVRHQRHFFFRNSLGGYDTLIARGLQETGLDIDRYITEFNTSGERQAWMNEGQYSYTQNAGAVAPDYKAYLAELMLSTEVWSVLDDYTLMKVIVTNTSTNLATDDEQRPTAEFTFVPVSKDQFYSNHF